MVVTLRVGCYSLIWWLLVFREADFLWFFEECSLVELFLLTWFYSFGLSLRFSTERSSVWRGSIIFWRRSFSPESREAFTSWTSCINFIWFSGSFGTYRGVYRRSKNREPCSKDSSLWRITLCTWHSLAVLIARAWFYPRWIEKCFWTGCSS